MAQVACKALRFGLDDIDPVRGRKNGEVLIDELNDLYGVLELFKKETIDLTERDPGKIVRKIGKVYNFMQYAMDRGALVLDGGCRAGRDGECIWPLCPQLREGEPAKSGRHCPLYIDDPEL